MKRLLQSIAGQTFTDFEVIISDDSDDDSVELLAKQYDGKFLLQYYKNQPVLGMPANWNYGISKVSGEWIKLMHDDDWFASPASLQEFANAATIGKKFIFSAYVNFFEATAATETVRLTAFWKEKIKTQPAVLIAKNVIGPPSVTLLHRSVKESYDERLKWRVDTDFYGRVLRHEKNYHYINKPLIRVGISEWQVTQSCLYKPEVELPEGLLLLQKYGVSSLKNILVYDAWWRLFRNMNITSKDQLFHYTKEEWPAVIISMLTDLSHAPLRLLRTGIISKLLMSYSYIKNLKKL